ncbi:MAG: hypothetical protein J3K34DRAFT_168014 [Monoraphidium minutum]|nr:MAG: hypothetical protein J3K34DRAFT_168014 [Monoraphidium minutum]
MRGEASFPLGSRAGALRLAVRKGRRLAQQHTKGIKAAQIGFGFAFGDVLTQHFHRQHTPTHDWRRTAAMAAAGAALGAPLSLGLYAGMDAAWPAATAAGAAGKFALDQALGCALWQAVYCALPGNDWYRRMLSGALASAAGAADGGVRDAVAYAAAMSQMVLPAPAAV